MTHTWPKYRNRSRELALGARLALTLSLVFAVSATAVAQSFEDLPPIAGVQTEDGYRSASRDQSAPRVRSVYESQQGGATNGSGDAYRPNDAYRPGTAYSQNDAYRPVDPYSSGSQGGYDKDSVYNRGPDPYADSRQAPAYDRNYDERTDDASRDRYDERYDRDRGPYRESPPPYREDYAGPERSAPTYSQGEILDAGHSFFGSVSKGLASVVEYAFRSQGAPTGYILGEDAGGAFVAGLRYGEGTLYSRRYPPRKVYWQGPSLGYDFGAEGSKTMVLVYNMEHPSQIYHRFAGVQGSAYLVGGVSIQFQKRDDVTLAPIRSGLGVRLGANVGYLKYTETPTWNPF